MIPLVNIPPVFRANQDLMRVIQPYITRAEQLALKYIKREKFAQHLYSNITKRLRPLRERPNFHLAFCRITDGMVVKATYLVLQRNVDLMRKGITNAENCIARMKEYAEEKERERAAQAKEIQDQAANVESEDNSFLVSFSTLFDAFSTTEDTKATTSDKSYKTASDDSSIEFSTDSVRTEY